MHLADAFIQSDLYNSGYTFFCMRVPWELNQQPFVLLTQCSTTEPQEHTYIYSMCDTCIEYILMTSDETFKMNIFLKFVKG